MGATPLPRRLIGPALRCMKKPPARPTTTARRWASSTRKSWHPIRRRNGCSIGSGCGMKSRPPRHRKDAQVAREVEVGLPIELSKNEQIELLRDFVKREFVSRGMVADFSLHLDNPENPHAHILLTTRDMTAEGFGQKNRGWNQTSELLGWRRGWAEVTNEHLARGRVGGAHRSSLVRGPRHRALAGAQARGRPGAPGGRAAARIPRRSDRRAAANRGSEWGADPRRSRISP